MRRLILSLIALALMQSVVAQVPEVNSRVCAECGGNEQRKQGGEWVQISDHKSWCPIAKKIAEAEAKAEAAAWSPDFSSIEYQYGHGVKCEECGLVQGHVSDCLIGYNQKLALKHSDHTWSDPEAYKRKINIIEERIRHAAQRAREERAQAQQQRLGGSSQQNQSTKLKDHEPMPEQKPAETLIPEMAKMPRTELPNSTRVSQDNVNYGAYYETFEKFPQQYTLGEIRQKIRDDASDFIQRQQNQQKRKARGRNK